MATISFRDAEAFTDIPQGERRSADLVAQVHTTDGLPELLLVHVEIQREHEPQFPQRMWQYYVVLRQRENLPVIPIALVLYPGREGIALEEYTESVLGQTYLTFRYVQISLPLLRAEEYVAVESPLGAGLAGVMKPPSGGRHAHISLHLVCLRRIRQAQESGEIDEARAFLLVNMVATYLPLRDEEREALRVQLEQQGDTTMEVTELTWADQIREEGREAGREEGREAGREEGREAGRREGAILVMRENIRHVIRNRFGSVPQPLEAALTTMAREDDLSALFDRVLNAKAISELP